MNWIYIEETDSTNALAVRLLEENDQGLFTPFILSAGMQTHGRGQYGRVWQMVKGNIALTLTMPETLQIAVVKNVLSLVVAVALYDVFVLYFRKSAGKLHLKWVNDILYNSAKIAGILIETHCVHGRQYYVIGIGVNIVCADYKVDYPVTSFEDQGIILDKQQFERQIVQKIDDYIQKYALNIGSLYRDRNERAAFIGHNVAYKTPIMEGEGIFMGLDVSGCLCFKTQNGISSIAYVETLKLKI